ncbi:MAG: PKD domain-containing protein [SAR202 cluster bacterium]|nr:PKD domain-containing protein [SAR202 cluster bacterium]
MSRRLKFLTSTLIGLMASLLLVVGVFSAAGSVEFIDPTDSNKDLTWARQGGQVGLQVTDSDLNVAVKRVLLPVDMVDNAATATTIKGSSTVTLSATSTISPTATTNTSIIGPGDTVLIGGETVRKVVTASTSPSHIVLNKPMLDTGIAFTISKVTTTIASANLCPNCAAAQKVIIVGTGNQIFVLNASPVIDSGSQSNPINLATRLIHNADTVVNHNDVSLVNANGTASATTFVQAVTASNGLVNVSNTVSNSSLYVMYWGSEANQTGSAVTVASQADPTGISVTLSESGPSTGIFRLNILATSSTSDASANPPFLKVAQNDVISLRYVDATPLQLTSASINVETTEPVFSNLSPSDGVPTQSARPEVEGDVTDADSGVSNTSVAIIFAIDDDGDGDIDSSKPAQEVNVSANGTITSVTGGYHAKQRLPASMAPSSNATIYWWLKAKDVAGNTSISDRQPTISGFADVCRESHFPATASMVGINVGISASVAGCQPFSVKVDFTVPALASAVTGSWWDASKTTTDKTESDVAKSKNTSIRVDFTDNMDGTTIQVTDFKVDGVAPFASDWHSGRPQSVFLTVPALAANGRPKIDVVGEVRDAAGNPSSSSSLAAASDGIAPTMTVSVTGTGGSRPVTTGQATIKIVSDEGIMTPAVTVAKVGNHDATAALSTPTMVLAILKTANTHEATFTGSIPGLYNVYVTGRDLTASNMGTTGSNSGPIDITSGTEAVLFEVDTGIPAPTIALANPADPTSDLIIDLSDEAKEYGLDNSNSPTTNPASVVASHDTHATTSIIAATLDGADIKATLTTTDEKIYRHKPSGLTVGTHTVLVTARDAAGNQKSFSASFTTSNLAPVVEAGPNITINEGSTLTLAQSTFSDPNTSDTHTAIVDWGDGTTSTATVTESATSGSVTASHVYPDDEDSPFTVKVTVTDNLGAPHTDSFQLVVNNVNPTLAAGADQTINKGATLTLAPATFADVGTLDTHSAVIIWGDGVHETVAVNQSSGTVSGSHKYNADGTFYPTIVVVDDDGGLVVGSFKATVGTGGPLPTLPNSTFGALALLTSAFIILVVWRRRQSRSRDGEPAI